MVHRIRNDGGRAVIALMVLALVSSLALALSNEPKRGDFKVDSSGQIPKLYYCLYHYRELSNDALDIVLAAAAKHHVGLERPWFLNVESEVVGSPGHFVSEYFLPKSEHADNSSLT